MNNVRFKCFICTYKEEQKQREFNIDKRIKCYPYASTDGIYFARNTNDRLVIIVISTFTLRRSHVVQFSDDFFF